MSWKARHTLATAICTLTCLAIAISKDTLWFVLLNSLPVFLLTSKNELNKEVSFKPTWNAKEIATAVMILSAVAVAFIFLKQIPEAQAHEIATHPYVVFLIWLGYQSALYLSYLNRTKKTAQSKPVVDATGQIQ